MTNTEEFRSLEWLREKTRLNEATALNNARRKERAKWQNVVAEKDTALAEKDTELAKQAELIAKLQAQLDKK